MWICGIRAFMPQNAYYDLNDAWMGNKLRYRIAYRMLVTNISNQVRREKLIMQHAMTTICAMKRCTINMQPVPLSVCLTTIDALQQISYSNRIDQWGES